MSLFFLLATLVARPHMEFAPVAPTRVESSQPLSFVFGGWSWSQSYLDVVDHEPVISFLSRPASFGPHITEPPGLPGYLISVSSLLSTCPPNNSSSLPLPPSNKDNLPENFACSPLCTGPSVPQPNRITENWIALVQRGQCPFVEKVRTAQTLGAKAVVVGGWEPKDGDRDDLLNMFSPEDASDITIPSTYVTYRSYAHLMSLIAASNTTTSGVQTISVILGAEESWGWFSPILTFLMLLLLPSFLTFLTLVIHRLREARRERLDRAPEDVVSHLPTRIWSGNGWEKESDWLKKLRTRALEGQSEGQAPAGSPDKPIFDLEGQLNPVANASETDIDEAEDGRKASSAQLLSAVHVEALQSVETAASTEDDVLPGQDQPWFEGQVECAICLSAFDPGDKVRILPCGHLFHIDEVDGWLVQRKKLCPICKLDVTQPTSAQPGTDAGDRSTFAGSTASGRPARLRAWIARRLRFSRTPNPPPSEESSTLATPVAPPVAPSERTPLLPTGQT